MPNPSEDDNDDVLYAARTGDVDDVKSYISQFGIENLAKVVDENGNTVLHMLCANGHIDALEYLLPLLPSPKESLSAQNSSGSTPLHWATLNTHLSVVQALVNFPDGPGKDLIDIQNEAGRSPLAEAENVGWDEGAKWLVEMMKLDENSTRETAGDAVGDADADLEQDELVPLQDIQVEIEDADGQVAKMTINDSSVPSKNE